MKYTHITVNGSVPFDYDLKTPSRIGDVIASGICNKNVKFKYAVTNNELELQNMINYPHYKETMLLTNKSLFKKYLFFDNVNFLPKFSELPGINENFEKLSNQTLAVLLASWSDHDVVLLFGCDIEDLSERAKLIKIMESNPTVKYKFCRKPNVNKIKLFDHLPNVDVMNYPEVKEYAKENT